MYVKSLCTAQSGEIDLIPLLKQYGSLAGELTELPDSASASISTSDRTYYDAKFSDLGIKVLDPSKAMDVPLGENTTLTGIALKEDGILRLQLRYPDIGSWWNPEFALANGVPLTGGTYGSDLSSFVLWTGSYDNPGCWLEMQFHLDGELRDDAELVVKYTDMPKLVCGTWQVDVPTGQLWVDPQDIPETVSETRDPAEETTETAVRDEPYVNVRLVKFFRLWREQDWQGMLDMCTSGWKAQTEDPLKDLQSIAHIRTPEIVSMEPLPAVEPEYLMDCTVRSGENRDDWWYRLKITMEKEADGLWYVNPESLRKTEPLSEKEIAARRSRKTGGTVWYYPTSSGLMDSMESLRYYYPLLADDLVPVGLSCESDGIRLEIISAAIEEKGSLILYSLKDLTGDRIGPDNIYNPFLRINDIDLYMDGVTMTYMEFDAAEHSIQFALHVPGDLLYSTGENLKCSLGSNLLFFKRTEIDLMQLLRRYEDKAWKLADPPEDISLHPYSPEYKDILKEAIHNSGLKVLDCTDSPEIPLDENVTLSGIGFTEDNMLHIQMHVVNNGSLTDSSGYEYRPVFLISIWGPDMQSPAVSPVEWASDEGRTDTRIEYAFRCTRESLNKDGLKAAVYMTDCYAHGPWEIEVPAESVRK